MIDTETLFKMLADTTRLRCLLLMQSQGELCVCELTHTLELSQPMISRHLAQLRDNELVTARREGQWMYYRINTKLPKWIGEILATTLSANTKKSPFKDDLKRLKNMANRPDATCCN